MRNKQYYLKYIIQFICCLFSCAAFAKEPKLLMSYWSYHDKSYSFYPVAGSFNTAGVRVTNKDMLDKLNYLNMIAYAFLWVDPSGFARFTDSKVDLSYLDNAFCVLNKNICLDRHNLYSPGAGNFSTFSLLQNNTHSLKKIISVGGARSAQSFDNAILNVDNFVNSIEKIIIHYHLNGVDLDFEPDNFTLDRMNGYVNLVSALRKKLGSDKIIIVTISADQNINAKSWKKISEQVNYVSDMCYEFHSPFNQPAITGYNSNLYADSNEPLISRYYHISCDQSIKSLIFLGVPADKIFLDYPSYALAYGGVKNMNHGLFQPFNQKKTPTFDPGIKSEGRVQYRTVLQLLKSGFIEHASFINNHINGVWAYNPQTKQLLTYDNPSLVKEKASYVIKNHLAGMMTWNMGDDVPAKNDKSLLKSASKGITLIDRKDQPFK